MGILLATLIPVDTVDIPERVAKKVTLLYPTQGGGSN